MNADLMTYRTAGITRDARRAGRSISRLQSNCDVRLARVDVETDLALSKVGALTTVTGEAMASVVRVATAQRHLEQLAPEAAGRLSFLADAHMLGAADLLSDFRHSLRHQ